MTSKRQRLTALIFFLSTHRLPEADDQQAQAVREPPPSTPDDLRAPFELAAAGRLDDEELASLIEQEFKDEGHLFGEFAQELEGVDHDPDKKLLLNSSMLVTAVAVFEYLLARVLGFQLRAFPNLLDASGRTFTLAELEEIESVEDARQLAVEDRVDAVMRESFADWETWFAKRAGVSFADCCIDRDAVFEVIQRRHLLVHTGGVVSKQYLERLGLDRTARWHSSWCRG